MSRMSSAAIMAMPDDLAEPTEPRSAVCLASELRIAIRAIEHQ
jgi:hypothetical protein